jgi:hypothetical protein
MPSSLVKFSAELERNGQNLYWSRAGEDGVPFRGKQAPMLPDPVYEERVTKVADYRNSFFDVGDPAQNAQFLAIMDRCLNGWFHLMHLERFWAGPDGRRTTYHYVEWAEYYMEDGTRTMYQPQSSMEFPGHG